MIILPSRKGDRVHGPPWVRWGNVLERRQVARNYTGSLSTMRGGAPWLGWLRDGALRQYQADLAGPGIAYVVMSYRTPIAWLTSDGEWRQPDVRYSRITSQHQAMIRAAITSQGDWPPAPDPIITVDPVKAAHTAMAKAEDLLIEYDAVGLPVNDGPLDWLYERR